MTDVTRKHTDAMDYLGNMECLDSDIMDTVLSRTEAYDPSSYTRADVVRAIDGECDADGFGALLSPAAEPFLERMAERVEDTCGCYVVPAFVGLGAPHWDQNARGIIMGLTRGTNRCHIARAALESIAFQANDVIRAMEEDSGTAMHSVRVDGGASANDFLCQFLADITGMEVLRPRCIESTALGAAYMAGLTVGFWDDEGDLSDNWSLDRKFVPRMDPAEREEHIRGWNHAVRCARLWSESDSSQC